MNNKNTNWKVPVIIGVGVIAVIFMIIFGVQGFQNKAINYETQVEEAQSGIKVQEKRRIDLVYNLADCVKQYDKHESETLKAIVDGRTSDKVDAENITTAINAVSESYPELKSNENYKQLMNELSTTCEIDKMIDTTVFKDNQECKQAIIHGMVIASMLTSRCTFYKLMGEQINEN